MVHIFLSKAFKEAIWSGLDELYKYIIHYYIIPFQKGIKKQSPYSRQSGHHSTGQMGVVARLITARSVVK